MSDFTTSSLLFNARRGDPASHHPRHAYLREKKLRIFGLAELPPRRHYDPNTPAPYIIMGNCSAAVPYYNIVVRI